MQYIINFVPRLSPIHTHKHCGRENLPNFFLWLKLGHFRCANCISTCSKTKQWSGFFRTVSDRLLAAVETSGAPRMRLFSHSGVRPPMQFSRDLSFVTASNSLQAVLTLHMCCIPGNG